MALSSFGENLGINENGLKRIPAFPEGDWAVPFFEAILRLYRNPTTSFWGYYFRGAGKERILNLLLKKEVFELLEPTISQVLLSDHFLEQKFCLELLHIAREKRVLAPIWDKRLRSYLWGVASPYLNSLALSCLREVGKVELQVFLKLKGSTLPLVRRRAWKWLFEVGHLEAAWDAIGGEEVPRLLLPKISDAGFVAELFQKWGTQGGKGNGSQVPLLSPRRAHYFKALGSLRNR
jgi:hypothetical protein